MRVEKERISQGAFEEIESIRDNERALKSELVRSLESHQRLGLVQCELDVQVRKSEEAREAEVRMENNYAIEEAEALKYKRSSQSLAAREQEADERFAEAKAKLNVLTLVEAGESRQAAALAERLSQSWAQEGLANRALEEYTLTERALANEPLAREQNCQ